MDQVKTSASPVKKVSSSTKIQLARTPMISQDAQQVSMVMTLTQLIRLANNVISNFLNPRFLREPRPVLSEIGRYPFAACLASARSPHKAALAEDAQQQHYVVPPRGCAR